MANKKKAYYVQIFCNGYLYGKSKDSIAERVSGIRVSDLVDVLENSEIEVIVEREELMDEEV